MDTIKLIKWLGFYLLIFLTAINLYFFVHQQKENSNLSKLKEQNISLQNKNMKMKEEVTLFSPTSREKHYQAMIEDAKLFVHSAYIQQKEGYSERRMAAKNIMTNELWKRFFPADTTYQDQIQTSISNERYYVQELKPNQNQVDVMVTFTHQLKVVATGNVDKTNLIVVVSFQKMGEKWIATNIKDVSDSTK
ncbi:hypothetical protein COJ46_22190 [Bacillus sp. AFS077874]|uniref:hypothetical protein n=1 Tax=Bacillus sp. AFS077874 TaxID=2033513 RepID=UPI000BF8BA3B|nr:hypothetical protein [Bacillus sp. AFS077874]PFM75263.1 hypothetical protein COJ46_22190 [Bacillus sp. AFS077874]